MKMKDSAQWMSRLHLYGLDFRDLAKLEQFCTFVSTTYDRLDAIVNNVRAKGDSLSLFLFRYFIACVCVCVCVCMYVCVYVCVCL